MQIQQKHLIIVSWEYPGVNSKGGTALARRIGQVARGFAEEGWLVSIVHKDHVSENIPLGNYILQNTQNGNTIKRYPVKGPDIMNLSIFSKISLLRKISTLFYTYFYGDRSHDWAKNAQQLFKINGAIKNPDLIIAFFTPRGPWVVAEFISKLFNVPWFADMQDTYDEGCGSFLHFFVRKWSQRILKTASKVIHVSPEWAQRDSQKLGINISVLRHAIPQEISSKNNMALSKIKKDSFIIFYGGSLDFDKQPPNLLIKAIHELNSENTFQIKMQLAGMESTYKTFLKYENANEIIDWLGWLSKEELERKITYADCLLIIGWTDKKRQVVPSKLYEYLSFNKPILLAGKDTGSISILIKEWNHPDVLCDTVEKIKSSLLKACKQDFSEMLQKNKCVNTLLYEKDLYHNYYNYYKSLKNLHE